ncbi:MAG: hypothetical protein QW794_03150 [Thermosphaera sp.]
MGKVVEPTQEKTLREGAPEQAPERTVKVLREVYRRNIKYPGMTISIVIDEETLQQLEPVERIRSKSGAHGEDVYLVSKPVLVLRYTRSNSGKARWSIYEVTLDSEKRIKYSDLPATFRRVIESYAEYYGIKLNIWEEEDE